MDINVISILQQCACVDMFDEEAQMQEEAFGVFDSLVVSEGINLKA